MFSCFLHVHVQVSHEFALNGNPQNPYCAGIPGVVQAYHNALRNVALWGPTCAAPIINHVANFAETASRDHTVQVRPLKCYLDLFESSLSGLWGEFTLWPMGRVLSLAYGESSLSGLWGEFTLWPMGRVHSLAYGESSLSGLWGEFTLWPMGRVHSLAYGESSLSGLWGEFTLWPMGRVHSLAYGESSLSGL